MLHFGARKPLSPFTKGAGLALLEWQLGVLRSTLHVSLLPSAPQEHVLLLGGRWFVVVDEADGAQEHLAGRGCGTPPWTSAVRRCGGAFAGTSLEAVSAELGAGSWELGSGISLPAFLASPPGWCEPEPWSLHLWNGKWNFPL